MENLEKYYYDAEFITPHNESYKWYLHNPRTLIAVEHGGTIVAFLNIMPIREKIYQLICSGSYIDKEMTVNDFISEDSLLNIKNEPLFLFLSCIVVDPAYRQTNASKILLEECHQYLNELKAKGVIFLAIVTDNVTEDGVKFSKKIGLECIKASNHGSYIYGNSYDNFNERMIKLLNKKNN